MTAMISDSSSSAHREGKPPARSAGEGTGAQIRDIFARPRPGPGDRPAAGVRTPVHDVPEACRVWMAAAFLLGAIARDTLGDPDAAGRALQRALDLTAHLYRKLGAHSRTQAVRQARALGLLALSA
jgi:hypothetical protein